ncbi:uncharacterized protein METZ01_LOCUS341185, partial [marine metagenome]
MKKFIPLLAIILALFAGNLMAQGAAEEQPNALQYAQADGDDNKSADKTNAEPADSGGSDDEKTLTDEEKAEAAADKAKAEAWLEGKDLADEYSGLGD